MATVPHGGALFYLDPLQFLEDIGVELSRSALRELQTGMPLVKERPYLDQYRRVRQGRTKPSIDVHFDALFHRQQEQEDRSER